MKFVLLYHFIKHKLSISEERVCMYRQSRSKYSWPLFAGKRSSNGPNGCFCVCWGDV